MMLLWLVVAYLVVSIGVGLYAATRVHNTRDYITAGRNLPMIVVLAMVFATWFGAETVLGTSATFLEEGFRGLISDPLGASACLVLFGLVFARPLYRMNLLTLGDFFRVPPEISFAKNQALHGSWLPDASVAQAHMVRMYHHLYHLKSIRHEDRVLRRDFYQRMDPEHRFQSIGYSYLADEPATLRLESIRPGRDYPLTSLPDDLR